MQFPPGFRLGVYEVIAPIGTGGMGEVYRARDMPLGRDVALKVLTHEASADPERQQRFEREARAVAALSDPNILTIYSFGTEDGVAYAAMELLEGHTLREELAQGPLPVRRVIHVATQMAGGLAAAHEKGIIHRDVKPENVFITPDGRVKLLDFGLARTVSDQPSMTNETQAARVTGVGMLLGSVGYMSPEQVSGAEADSRSDLFSLGIVIFEMLTGRLPFLRGSAVDTIAATLKDDPPAIADLNPDVPSWLEQIVRRCLEKSPLQRFQSARDLAFALSAFAVPPGRSIQTGVVSSGTAARKHGGWVTVMAAVAGVSAGAIGATYWAMSVPQQHPLVTFTIPGPPGMPLANVPSKMLAISPDGERLVFAVERDGHRELWVRNLESLNAAPLPGTQDAGEPFWSPDGRHVGFFADTKLKRVDLDGTMPLIVCDAPPEAHGATWSTAGIILFSDANGGLSRVPDTGGIPTPVTTPDRKTGHESDSWPQFLPDGRRFLYLRQKGPSIEIGATAYLGSIDGTGARELLSGVFNASFIPPDRLLFADADAIKVQRVDLERGRMTGEIEEIPADVDRHLGRAALAVSQTGTLAYAAAGSRDHRLVWIDRQGRETGIVAADDAWRDIALSPDDSRVAVQRIVSGANDIWTIDLMRGVPSRFTFSVDVDDDPVWSPDGGKIAFSSVQNGVPGIFQKSIDGARDDAELLFTNQSPVRPTSWSPDGRWLLFEQTVPKTSSDIWMLPTQGDRTPRPYLVTRFAEADAHFSPDGEWVAYTSDESGRDEVYVRSFPDAHGKIQISTGGGESPRWAPRGHELYFLSPALRLMAVKVRAAARLQVGPPAMLFGTVVGLGSNRYAAARDGQHFLLSVGTAERSATPVVVVLNWAEHLANGRGVR